MSQGRITELLTHATDSHTSCVMTIGVDHVRAHEGWLFDASYSSSTTVANGAHIALVMGPATTGIAQPYIHLRAWEAGCSTGAVLFQVIESPTPSTVIATTIVPVNHRRLTLINSGVTVVPRMVGTNTTSVVLYSTIEGGNSPQGKVGNLRTVNMEWLLDPSKAYAVKVTNLSGSAGLMSVGMAWYQLSYTE